MTGDDQGVTRVTDALSNVTDFYFDEWARTTYLDAPGDAYAVFVYDSVGNLKQAIDGTGGDYTIDYNGDADPTEISDPLSQVTTIEWDDILHVPTVVTDALGRVTKNSYDPIGNLTETIVDWDAAGTRLNLKTQYFYEDSTNPGSITKEIIDPGSSPHLNLVTLSAYDAAGNLTSRTIDPNPQGQTGHLELTWSWTYNAAGRRLTETDPNDHTTTYTWDLAGRLNAVTDPTDATWTFSRDVMGELVGSSDPLNRATIWVYLGLPSLPTAKIDPDAHAWFYTYDAAHRMDSTTDPEGHTTTFAYDDNGRLVSQTVDPGQSGHLNLTTTYAYDAAGRVIAETDPLDRTTSYVYDAAGRVIGMELPNEGVWTYAYDDVGNQIGVTDPLDRTTTYDYDGANRLIAVTDPLGQVTDYDYNAADELTGTTGAVVASYSYDENGNRIAAGNDTFQYDWKNRLTQADVGSVTVDYAYTGDDLRTERTQGSTTVPYLWDREAGLPEIVDDGTNVYLQLDEGELATIDPTTSAASYPLADGLGSARARTDGGGSVIGTADWDAWGNSRAASGTQGAFGWAGELTDDTTGLTHLRARDYSAGTGRFVQRDPVIPNAAGTQGRNPYWYGNDAPTTLTDPAGTTAGPQEPHIGDPTGGALDGLRQAVATIRQLLGSFDSLPEVVRGLVIAIIAFVMIALILIIVFYLIELLLPALSGVPIFGFLFLMRFFLFVGAPFQWIMQRCFGSSGRLCTFLFTRFFPNLPSFECAGGVGFDLGFSAFGGDTGGAGSEAGCNPGESSRGGNTADELMDELEKAGIKFTRSDVIHIGRDANGRIVWLERGNARAGLEHILDGHADDFARRGVNSGDVDDLVFKAATEGRQVGGTDQGRIYEVDYNGKTQTVQVAIGSNGFIVSAYPVSK